MSNGIRWAIDEIELLRALDGGGMQPTSIAPILDRSVAAVKTKLAELRGKDYRITKRPRAEAIEPEFVPERRDGLHPSDLKHLRLLLAAKQREKAA